MASTTPGQSHRRSRYVGSGLAAALTVGALVGGSFLAPAASAQVGSSKGAKPTKIVKEVTRSPYGVILTNLKKHSLYIQPMGTCTGSCLAAWPPLLLPAGKTTPAGAPGLGTTPMGSRLQVTYNSKPLYTFYTDNAKSVNGQNVDGFVVAQVH